MQDTCTAALLPITKTRILETGVGSWALHRGAAPWSSHRMGQLQRLEFPKGIFFHDRMEDKVYYLITKWQKPIYMVEIEPTEPSGGGQPRVDGGESPAEDPEVGVGAGEEAFVAREEEYHHHQGGQQGPS